MRGEKHRLSLIGEGEEDIHQFLAGYGVDTAGRFVEDQQLRAVRKRQRERVFHLHAVRELRGRLGFVKSELFYISVIGVLSPIGIKRPRRRGNCL